MLRPLFDRVLRPLFDRVLRPLFDRVLRPLFDRVLCPLFDRVLCPLFDRVLCPLFDRVYSETQHPEGDHAPVAAERKRADRSQVSGLGPTCQLFRPRLRRELASPGRRLVRDPGARDTGHVQHGIQNQRSVYGLVWFLIVSPRHKLEFLC